ncbi:MAG: hypothetical protein HFE98_00660 [Ruminiclostridium sp.]|jgi:hypothetical protein|nr:hypothetical protein [Ruminiclostridium sp.]MCI9465927.1 hypothetical protein [Ruminiclostridium sp.]
MKTWLAILTAMACALALTACASAEASGTPPPPLYLHDNGNAVEAMLGTYAWFYPSRSRSAKHIEACGGDPLQCRENMPSIKAPAVALQFVGNPDRVTVCRWDADALAQGAQPEGTPLPIRVDIREDTVVQLLDLSAGNYIYAITLYWEESKTLNGVVAYYFQTQHPNAAPEAASENP